MIRILKKFVMLVAALFLSLGTASCGVKPKTLSPPEGAEDSAFPRTYPDLKHDPQPEE